MITQLNPQWFEDFFDSTYQFTGILDRSGQVIRANRVVMKVTGLAESDLNGVHLWEVPWAALSQQNREDIRQAFTEALQGKFKRRELEIQRSRRSKLILDLSFKPVYTEAGEIKFIIFEGQDITSHKRTREALFQSEARFQTVFEEAGIGIVINSVDGIMLDTNPAFQTMLGYTAEELEQHSSLDITHPSDKAISQALFSELIAGTQKSYAFERRYSHKNGQTIWGNITSSLVYGTDGQVQFVIEMVENITVQKQIEVELRELRHRLMYGRERERLRIAQDLHDGPLQEIIGISYQVQALESSLNDGGDVEQLQSIRTALQTLAKSVRGICGELRPPTLMPFGLQKTIRSHAEELQAAHPELEVILELVHDRKILSDQQRIVLFRVYQEALRNVIRHSKASKIWVRFNADGEQATLEIQDNGVGFEPPRRWIEFARQGHLGLVGAMERAREAGGNLEITSTPGEGTAIRATVPLSEESNQSQLP